MTFTFFCRNGFANAVLFEREFDVLLSTYIDCAGALGLRRWPALRLAGAVRDGAVVLVAAPPGAVLSVNGCDSAGLEHERDGGLRAVASPACEVRARLADGAQVTVKADLKNRSTVPVVVRPSLTVVEAPRWPRGSRTERCIQRRWT